MRKFGFPGRSDTNRAVQLQQRVRHLPDSLFSTAEMSDDCVSKFASLLRSRV